MTTTLKLDRIAARCRELLDGDGCKSVHAEAGWRSTIAAIDALPDMGEHDSEILAANIMAAWPDELID
jgi:hypothetical protein